MKHLYKYAILIITALLTHQHIVAQQAGISALRFTTTTHDYGHIAEDGGSVVCSFEAVNTAEQSIEVTKISTTCGCTSAIYESRSVAPGEIFRFEVRYDPMNRPGRIEKDIIVHTSDTERLTTLHITGYVQPRERSIEEIYPFDMGGGLRLMSTFHAFGFVEQGKSTESVIECVNNSDKEISITISPKLSSGALTVDYPRHMAPHTTADIRLCYTIAPNSDIYGTLTDILSIGINGIEAQYAVSTQVVATDNFDLIDDISAPRADISKNIIKFGDVKVSNGVCYASTVVTNGGATPLIIRRAEASSEAVRCEVMAGTTLAPEESIEIVVALDVRSIERRDEPFAARIRLITNDPIRPMQTLRIGAIVTE